MFLVAIMNPVQWPSRDQLLDTLKKFRQQDTDHTGYVTQAQYEQVKLQDEVNLFYQAVSYMIVSSF